MPPNDTSVARAIERVRALREAGKVKRFHTMPIIGEYTVGQHSYDAVNLLIELYPGTPRLELVLELLRHDVGERWHGDVPSPAKWADHHLKAIYERGERASLERWQFCYGLDDEERLWVRAIDLTELWLFQLDQLAFGNRNIEDIFNHERGIIDVLEGAKAPQPVIDFVNNYQWKRGKERPHAPEHSRAP